jgi:hypothetical protein
MEIKKTSLVQKVLSIIGMDDKGKVESFFKREIGKLQKSITIYTRNLENAKFNSENVLNDLREQLEDAQTALEAVYTSVKIEDIATNALADAFSEKYWNAVDVAESKVQNIEKAIEEEVKRMEEKEKTITESISITKIRIEAIS